ncbi:MAG: D-aminoacylase [Verrucomicrobiaceae bacterium]|nr:D-aminoacylase [Verrucomicrobiaceae bacterium]
MKSFVLHSIIAAVLAISTAAADLVIVNGLIVDGTGAPPIKGSVRVSNGRIESVGEANTANATIIDAAGRFVAPGFIDVHTHSEQICTLPEAENFLRMGVTTIVTGNCGTSKTDVGAFFKEMKETGLALNVATLIGHNSVREKAMGGMFRREPNAAQMAEMKRLVDQAMQDGAVGLSTGLIYLPGTFAKTDEIVELAKVSAAHGGIYASHIRSESYRIFGAIDEFLTIAREAKIPAELSHIKLSGPSAWGKASEVLAILDKARAEGLKVTHDQYVYTASSTSLAQLIPDDAREGGRTAFVKRVADPVQKAKIMDGMKSILSNSGRDSYDYAVVAQCRHKPEYNGLSVPEITKKEKGTDALESQIETVIEIECNGGASAVFHGMNEQDLITFLKHPLTMLASDGNPRKFGDAVPHPRSYGNNARLLGKYVRDNKIMTVEEAVRRMAGLPAETFQLEHRGVLKPGAHADIVVFDLERVADPSQFDDPHHYAEGFTDVIVAGETVLHGGKLTGARPGGPLRFKRGS